jgi:predicted RNase H-like HicB family nuclease
MITYRVVISREGKWWMVRVPDIDGITQARRLNEAEDMARSLIAITLDVPEDSFNIAAELEAIEDIRVTERLERLHIDQAALAVLSEKTREESRELARDLAATGLPVRDIGEILSVSFQRAQQLITDEPAAERMFMTRSAFHAFTADLERSNESLMSVAGLADLHEPLLHPAVRVASLAALLGVISSREVKMSHPDGGESAALIRGSGAVGGSSRRASDGKVVKGSGAKV